MTTGQILDAQIDVSSAISLDDSGRYSARLGKAVGMGAWRPLASDPSPVLRVEFEASVTLRAVAVQGFRDEWVTHLLVETSDDARAKQWRSASALPLVANRDGENAAMIVLSSPVACRRVRLRPTEWHSGIALRAEFYGSRNAEPSAGSGANDPHHRRRLVIQLQLIYIYIKLLFFISNCFFFFFFFFVCVCVCMLLFLFSRAKTPLGIAVKGPMMRSAPMTMTCTRTREAGRGG